MSTFDDDVIVTGSVSAGSIYATSVRITPVANTPTMVEVTGVSLRGTGTVTAQATAHTSVPGSRVVETSVKSVSASGCQVWLYRSNATETVVSVLMWRDA